jgi:hypothetical protein
MFFWALLFDGFSVRLLKYVLSLNGKSEPTQSIISLDQEHKFPKHNFKNYGVRAYFEPGSIQEIQHRLDTSFQWIRTPVHPRDSSFTFIFGGLPEDMSYSGSHNITFRFVNSMTGGNTDEVFRYRVNSSPSIEMTSSDPMFVNSDATSPIALPISVSDEDGDLVTLFYRFTDEDLWSEARNELGVPVLPAAVFSNSHRNVASILQVYASDGMDTSPGYVNLTYWVDKEKEDTNNDQEPAEDSGVFGNISLAGVISIMVGVLAAGAAVSLIVLIVKRHKKKSSSTGLVNDE